MAKYFMTDTIKINTISTLFYNEFSQSFVFPGETHASWEFVYVDKGTAIITAGEKSFSLSQGEYVFHKPDEFHALKSSPDNPPNVFVIIFTSKSPSMKFFENMTGSLPKALRYHITEILSNAKITISSLEGGRVEILENPAPGGAQMIRTHLEQLFIELMRNTTANAFSISNSVVNNKTIATCIECLEKHIYGNLSIDQLCSEINYSRTYICTLFKKTTGKTVNQYYNELKIEEAKLLIRKNLYTFTEISDLLCFNTPTYFSHVFSKVARMSPSEYKGSLK